MREGFGSLGARESGLKSARAKKLWITLNAVHIAATHDIDVNNDRDHINHVRNDSDSEG